MQYTTRLLLSVAFAAVSLPAVAADYAPPIFVEEAAPWVPVEIGSGWYLRGDVTYNLDEPLYDFEDGEFELSRVGGSLGFGYHFNDLFRSDLTVSYLGGDSRGVADVDAASYSQWNGMANAYVDLGTVAGFTPYVGAGAGLTYTRQEIDTALFDYTDRQYNFSYALMAGLSYQATKNVSVDVGYQFLDTPGLERVDPDTFAVSEGQKQHLVKVGLRYDLW
jgi:opacity protein-like surface antigen